MILKHILLLEDEEKVITDFLNFFNAKNELFTISKSDTLYSLNICSSQIWINGLEYYDYIFIDRDNIKGKFNQNYHDLFLQELTNIYKDWKKINENWLFFISGWMTNNEYLMNKVINIIMESENLSNIEDIRKRINYYETLFKKNILTKSYKCLKTELKSIFQ